MDDQGKQSTGKEFHILIVRGKKLLAQTSIQYLQIETVKLMLPITKSRRPITTEKKGN